MMRETKAYLYAARVTWERQIDVCRKELTPGLDP